MRCARCGQESPEGMRFCGYCGASLAQDPPALAPAGDGAQRRHMTVMFCDLVESTPLAQRLDAEEFRDLLTAYQQACVRAIERLGGYLARYVGDGVIAYFGYPRAHEDDAQRAVHAALGVLDELVAVNAGLRATLGVEIQVRIGLHSGVVVVGQMGAGEFLSQHEIVGEMPHIAARIESVAPPGSVAISEDTLALIDGYFETESLGTPALKGVDRRIGVHRVLRATGAEGRLGIPGARPLTPVVGRERELSLLRESWEQAAGGQGQLVHITGEAGIGKSRLVRALVESVGAKLACEQVWQCSAHHGSTALYPVTRALERLIGVQADQPAQARREALELAASAAGLETDQVVPLLAATLGIDVGALTAPTLSPRDARTATLQVLEALLLEDPRKHPLLLVVEDLQLADPTTLELLGRIIRHVQELPVLCVVTFRREFDPPWPRRRDVVSVELGPLAPDEVRVMVAAAGGREPDPAVLEWVHSAADGVPLFIEEMLKTLEFSGGADTAPAGSSVPPTLEGLLTERLDRLPDLGDVIDVASVLGREFDRALLESLQPMGGAALEPALALLVAQGVIRSVDSAQSRFEFTHALLQEAAYARLLRRRRHSLHGRVALALTEGSAGSAEREPELIAYHWANAAEPAKAAVYWRAAGIRALERAAFQEAAEHFRRGLEALDEKPPDPGDDLVRADFLTHRAAAMQAARGYAADGVDDAYAAARRVYERIGKEDRLVAVIRGEWMFHLLRGQYGPALELADEMLGLAAADGDATRLSEGHLYSGLIHMYLGNLEQSRDHLDQAFERYRRPELPDEIYDAQGDTGVGALAYNAVVLWNLGYPLRSQEYSDRSLELAEQVDGQVTRAQAWGMRTMLHLTRAERAEFAAWVERCRAHSLEHNLAYWSTLSNLFAGWMQGRAGELLAGLRRVEDSLAAYIASGSTLNLPHFQVLLADLLLLGGDHARALKALRRGEQHIEATGERFSESELHRFTGRALMSGPSPDPDGATAAFVRAVQSARSQQAKLLELRAVSHLIVHQRSTGESVAELDALRSLCEWFAETPELPDVARARKLLETEAVTQ